MKNLFKKFSVIALLLVAVFVTVGCGGGKTKYTVSYHDVNTDKIVGVETVVEGNEPSGVVKDLVLEGGLFKDKELTQKWEGGVTGNVTLYGKWNAPEGEPVDGYYTYQGDRFIRYANVRYIQVYTVYLKITQYFTMFQ